ncbi:hypothetical protein B0T25DRAFT_508243 [Lasiosphaeria hispida]|uniref:Uncharacterized protein n=1 Tax=Lasiosphaeria hispida TaxID=260671 RepID=A0AAJ0H817_9PEZI|nr:hypothetical protein B0T25DRAFT_508243 [Lasiosphaeria hispida]
MCQSGHYRRTSQPSRGSPRLSDRCGLMDERNALADQNDGLQLELGSAHRQLQNTERQLQAAEEQVKKLRQEAATFRSIILEEAGTQKVSDEEVVSSFSKLRQATQKLSRLFPLNDKPSLSDKHQERAEVTEFYNPARWGSLSTKDQGLLIRAKIFEILYDRILVGACFGLDGFEKSMALERPGGGREGKRDPQGTIEPGLQRFERLLKEKNIRKSTIEDWRITTIRCAEKCQVKEETSKATASEILFLFEPLISKQIGPTEVQTLRSAITELCRDAFDLRMTMRMSKEGYACKMVNKKSGQRQSLSSNKYWVDAMAVEGSKNSEASDEIAYTLFGALVKCPDGRDGKVLEKGQVVLIRKQY